MHDKTPSLDQLTKRELAILEYLAAGLSDQQIGANLFLSSNTIRWYNRQIYSKLQVRGRTQAIARASELGLLGAPQPDILSLPSGHNLPPQSTTFIGRSREIAEVLHLLGASRLLTLSGMGGIGKTRLALQVASQVLPDFPDGVYFIDLAPINDPALVPKTVASALEVMERPRQPITDTLCRVLAERELLLLIDNFEHVVAAAPFIADLLAASSRLKIMLTSREALRLSGEQEYPVPVLSLPPQDFASVEAVRESEAGALFVQRVRMIQPRFALTEGSAPIVAQICARLEGLPLAIELAAARCKLLTPQTLLERLDTSLNLLTAGSRDLPARQRTLRDTLEWSYSLLTPSEKMLFARLAIFRGGCSLDAVEMVCGHDLSNDVLNVLSSLVDKSLVQQKETPQGEPRFIMLETVHQYAAEQLVKVGEADTLRRLHAEYFVGMAEQAEPELRMTPHIRWFQRFMLEQDNIRDVFTWALGEGDPQLGIRLASSLWLFWFAYGYHAEGQGWTQRLMPHLDHTPETERARFLIAAGNMAMTSSTDAAKSLFLRAIDLSRRLSDRSNTGWALAHLASATLVETGAMATAEEALSLFRQIRHQPGTAYALNVIGEIARYTGDDARAREAYEECLDVCLETGELRRVAIMYFNLAFIAQHEGDHTHALNMTWKAVRIARDMNNRGEIAWCLPIVAGSLAALGQPEQAARLLGTSEAFLERIGTFTLPTDQQEFDRIRARVCAQIGDTTFESERAAGRKMSLDQALASLSPQFQTKF